MKKLLLVLLVLSGLTACNTDEIHTPDHKAQIDNNSDRIAQLEIRVTAIDMGMLVLDNKIEDVAEEASDANDELIEEMMDEFDDLQRELEDAFEAMGNVDSRLRRKIQRLQSEQRQTARRLNGLDRAIRSLFSRVGSLDRFRARVSVDLSELEEEVEELAGTAEEHAESIEDLEDSIEELEGSLDDSDSCIVQFSSVHSHGGGSLYGDVDLVCGSYSHRLRNHTRVDQYINNDEDSSDDDDSSSEDR